MDLKLSTIKVIANLSRQISVLHLLVLVLFLNSFLGVLKLLKAATPLMLKQLLCVYVVNYVV